MLLKTYNFWNNKVECVWGYQRFLCYLHYSLYFLSFVIFFPVLHSILFSSYLKHSVEWLEFILFMLWSLPQIFYECFCYSWYGTHLLMLCIDGLFIISSVPPELNERLWLSGYLSFDKNITHMCLWYIYVYVTPFPNDMCIFSTICIIFKCWFISGLIKSILEISLSGKKSQFLSEVVLLLPRDLLFITWVYSEC